MKKLFLTSFVFTTGGIEYSTDRLVLVTSTDVPESAELTKEFTPIDPWLEVAYNKAMAWFPTNYPKSELKSCMTHPAIE